MSTRKVKSSAPVVAKRPRRARRAASAADAPHGRRPTKRDALVDLGDHTLPLYKSIKCELIKYLSSGEVRTGMALPTEKQLSDRYGVSVGTVRRALSDLVAERVVVRQQGRGTFLAPFDSSRMLNSFWHVARKDGVREPPVVQTLRFQESRADGKAASQLCIRPGDRVFSILNVMVMGGGPVLVDRLQIPHALFPGLTRASFTARKATIYDLYRDSYGINVVKTIDRVSAVAADRETARLLDLDPGTPLLEIVRVAFTFDDKPVELRRSLLCTENYEFVDVTGGSGTS